MKIYLIFITVLVLFSICKSPIEKKDNVSALQLYDIVLFTSLLDSLTSFIKINDSLPHPMKCPTMYHIEFSKVNSDSIILIGCYVGLRYYFDKSEKLSCKGYFNFKNKKIIVYDLNTNFGAKLINYNKLERVNYKEIECGMDMPWTVIYPEKIYKIINLKSFSLKETHLSNKKTNWYPD